jgi:cobyrinic acid a,c-diamide synthase
VVELQPRLVIAGTHSGVGKTTVTLGLMAAFVEKGNIVQGFKCGPDYIDPSYHRAVTKRASRNLDSWMVNEDVVNDIFIEGCKGADLSIIEGVMGFYDGKASTSDKGSTADISLLLQAPVLLVVDISGMARSAAAVVKGFQQLNEKVKIAGVILNGAGSERHAEMCSEAIKEACGIPALGYLKKGDVPSIPERHLGLVPALERGEHDSLFSQLAAVVSRQFDLERIERLALEASALSRRTNLFQQTKRPSVVKIAVAYDAAFHFYYEENFTLLRQAGAELVYFSPLRGEDLPSHCDGLYLGGGFPEEFADELSQWIKDHPQLKKRVQSGLPTLAECGGYMFLGEQLTTTKGKTVEMAGVIPMVVQMENKLVSLGYRDVTPLDDSFLLSKGQQIRGHEFHYSKAVYTETERPAYFVKGLFGEGKEGYMSDHLLAGYTHLHFASEPAVATQWVKACEVYKNRRLHRGQVSQ